MEIIYTAITIFGIAAILGMYLLSLVMRDKETPKGASIIHGLFAAIGLGLLVIYCAGRQPGPVASIIVFTIAALGGVVLIYKDITGRKVPKWLGILHGLTALAGFLILIDFAIYK